MRVLITAKNGYSNPRRSIELPCGAVAEVSDDLAVRLLNNHLAVLAPAARQKPVETVAKAPAQNAAKRTG